MGQHLSSDALDNDYEYELFSVLMHRGTAVGGHYYALIKSDAEKWCEFNDAKVPYLFSGCQGLFSRIVRHYGM